MQTYGATKILPHAAVFDPNSKYEGSWSENKCNSIGIHSILFNFYIIFHHHTSFQFFSK